LCVCDCVVLRRVSDVLFREMSTFVRGLDMTRVDFLHSFSVGVCVRVLLSHDVRMCVAIGNPWLFESTFVTLSDGYPRVHFCV
jgi:hypothetical protein